MQNKIRLAQEQKVPYMLVLGDREVEARTVAPRARNAARGEQQEAVRGTELADRLARGGLARRTVPSASSGPVDADPRPPRIGPRDCRSGSGLCYPPASAGIRVAVSSAPVDRIVHNEGEQTISRDLRVNQMIRIPQVRVVDEEGAQLGVMPTPRALEMAQERGLDLVEVAPMAAPPVVKFLDFGQYKYDLTKREKEAKRKQRSVTFKEVRLSPKIGTGDFDTKVHRAIEFLEDGDRIKVTVRFRGRELTHPELGRNLLARFVDRVKDHGVAERTPLLEGKSMHITMASLHKPKTHEAPARAAPRRANRRPSRADGRRRGATGDRRRSRTQDHGHEAGRRQDATDDRHRTEAQDRTEAQPEPAPAPAEARRRDVRPPAAAASGRRDPDRTRNAEHAGPRAGDVRRVRPSCPR